MENKEKLTPLMSKFVDEYLKDPSDGGNAYMRASGTTNKKSASVQASKFMSMDKIQNALKERAKSTLGFLEARIIQNVEFWLDIRDGKQPGEGEGKLVPLYLVKDLLDEHGLLDKKLNAELGDIPYHIVNPVKVQDRMKASENLGRYMNMFVEQKNVNVTAQVQIVDDIK